MSGAVHLPASPCSRAALARLGPALAASALAHLALLAAAPPGMPWRVASYPGDVPITVRLAPAPVLVPEIPALPEPEVRRTPPQPGLLAESAGRLQSQSSPSVAEQTGTEALALLQAADSNYYTARDLDRYPRPLAPLRIIRVAGDGEGEVRLEILIDEHGTVKDMTFVAPAASARLQEEMRATLAATRFLPAEKDGRAVRSRIVLSITGTHTFSVPRNLGEDDAH
jgi:protein TonB